MKRSLRVLHVEDSERDVALLARHLTRAGYALTSERVETAEQMRAALLARDEWDVILCDYSMPHFNAILALDVLKETGLDIPFIIISGTVGEAVAVEAMRAGASDYLMKDNLVRLTPTIERELHEAENRRARRRAEEALKASEAELRALFAAMTDVIFVLDAEGRYLKVAPTDPTYMYKPPGSLLGQTLHEVFPKDEADFFLAHIRRALDERQMHRVEYSMRIGEAEVWFDGSVSPMSEDSVIWVARDITEHKRVEEALRETARSKAESLALLDTILASAPIGFAFHNREMVFERINEMLAAINGLSVEQHLGRTLRDVLPEMAALTEPIFRLVLETGEPVINVELSGETPSDPGRQHYWLASFYPVRTNSDEVLGVGVLVLEITERKRAEEALRESEERYRLLFENNPHPMWVYDIETLRFIAVNEAAVRHYGYSREEFLTMNIKDIRPPEDVPALIESVAGIGEGLGESGVWKHRKKDGGVIEVEITSHTLVFAGRDARVVLANDVTERNRAEERLRRQLDFTEAITTSLGEGVYALDERGRVTFMNPAAEAALGWTQAELLGRKMHEAIHFQNADGTLRPANECPLLRVLKSGDAVDIDGDVFTRKDGSIFPVSYTSSPIITEGRVVGAVLAFRDITERKTLEEQLRQSQKMEAVGQLAGGVAHDFNNLLTAINGYSDLAIRRLKTGDPLRNHIEEIKKAGERAAALTRQLLAFSRKQVLQPKVLDLNAIVSEMEKMLRRLIGEDMEFRTALASDLGSIKADPGQIEQVLLNLCVNARDAMPGGGKLTIETSNVYLDEEYASRHVGVTPGPYVMLAVSDTGFGMNAETLSRIFEPFFTTKEAGKGTGLGLSTVYGIIQQSGGNVWVYSEVGRGTTFKVYLPRADEGAREYKQRNASPAEAARGTETILLAEDDEIVRRLARDVLEMYGYRVLEAANGGAALLICERHAGTIDLLVTDAVMPEMSGRELSERLSSLRPDMKVLYMSGYADTAVVHQGMLDEWANFLQKPFTPDALTRKVRELLDAPPAGE